LEATPFARVSKWLSLEAVPFGVPLERALSEAITGQAQTAQMIRSIAEGDGRLCSDQRPGISDSGSTVTSAGEWSEEGPGTRW